MVVREYYMTRTDGVKLYKSYSDADKYILQNETGVEYDSAIDVENANYTYTETDKPIEYPEETDIEQLADVIDDAYTMASDLIGE